LGPEILSIGSNLKKLMEKSTPTRERESWTKGLVGQGGMPWRSVGMWGAQHGDASDAMPPGDGFSDKAKPLTTGH